MYRLESSDKQILEISEEAIRQSITLNAMVEGTGLDKETVIPLESIDSATAKKVVEWCEKHKTDPLAEPEVNEAGPKPSPPPFDMPRWDREFLGKDALSIPEMARLVTAANYLEIPWLYKFCCKRIFTDYIRDRSVEQLRAMLEPREADASSS